MPFTGLAAALVLIASPRSAHAAETTAPARDKAAPAVDTDDDDDEEPDFSIGAETDLNARYVWRGLALSTGPVAQPAAWATVYGLNAILWTNVMLTNEAPKRLSAIVPAVSYTFEWEALTIEPGFLYYDTPGQPVPPRTAEASLEAALAVGPIQLVTTDYVDVANAPGAYYGTIGTSWEPKRGRWSFKALVDVGWGTAAFNQVYFDTHSGALDVAEAAGKVQYAIDDVWYVALHAEGSSLLSASIAEGRPTTLGNVGLTFGGEVGL
jgi:hypothetical protein